MRISNYFAISFCFFAVVLFSACSMSYSSGKSSDSISASFDSISTSSGSSGGSKADQEATVYAEDIAVATELYGSGSKSMDKFLRAIASIARKHGIIDWEQEKRTFVAMGMGLRQSGISEQQIAGLPYFSSLVGSADFELLLEGYNNS